MRLPLEPADGASSADRSMLSSGDGTSWRKVEAADLTVYAVDQFLVGVPRGRRLDFLFSDIVFPDRQIACQCEIFHFAKELHF